MNENKIILSFPYSGAFYHFIDKTLLGGRYATWDSGYYTWLFGKQPDKWVSMALTFSILYPEIVLAPRDHPLPKMINGSIESTYQNPDLGIIVDWNDYNGMSEMLSEKAQEDIQDPIIKKMLKEMKIPPNAAFNLLYDIRYELHLSQKHKARIVCARGRKRIVDYLLKRDFARKFPTNIPHEEIQFVEEYIEISGLEYELVKIEDLYAIKEDEDLQKYASSFRKQMHSLPTVNSQESATVFNQLAENALEASATARKYAKYFSRAAKFVSWTSPWAGLLVGLAPGGGTVTSGLEKGLDVVINKNESDVLRHEWYDLAPRVSFIRSHSQFVKNVRQIKPQNKQ